MQAYQDRHGLQDRKALIDYAFSLTSRYGNAAAALACAMYDRTAKASGVIVPAAEPAEVPGYGEVAKAVNGTLKQSPGGNITPAAVSRLVKRTGADTTLYNARRDGAQFAWVPHGDSCPFCIMIASRGWQYMSRAALNGSHAEHIHANCDCEYAVRFDSSTNVAGYDPDRYLKMYKDAEGSSSRQKINSMRRMQYKNSVHRREANHQRTGDMPSDEYAAAKDLWNRVEEIDLSQTEKEHIYEEFDNNLSQEEKGSATVCRPIGNYWYKAVHLGHNQYKIYDKEPIDTENRNVVDEVLTEIFGDEWRQWQ